MGIKILCHCDFKNKTPDMPNKLFSHKMLHGGSDLQHGLINGKKSILCS